MKHSKFIMLSLMTATALFFTVSKANTAESSKPMPVAQVNLNKYVGKWYEVARLPMYFQRNCASDVSATYTLKTNAAVEVNNQCMGKDGKPMQSIGEATKNGDSGSTLKVTFLPQGLRWLPFGKADYWVLALDNDYQYALVGTPDQKYLWLLSRTPTMPENVYQNYLNLAKQQGYDLSKLIKTVQN